MPPAHSLHGAGRRLSALPAASAAALTGLLGLAACDKGPATVTPFMHAGGAFDFLTAATRNDGPLYMEIDGAPFQDDSGLETRISAVMERALQSRVLHLTTDQSAAEDPRFRLVLVFNPPDKGEVQAFCEHQPGGGPASAEARIDLRAGFCRGDDVIAVVDGWAKEVERPDDQKFEQLMRQVARDIFSRKRAED